MPPLDKLFAKMARDGSRDRDPFLCRHLRTKSWEISRSPSAAPYWCLKTLRPDGPDGHPALPEDCTDERPCFEAAPAPRQSS